METSIFILGVFIPIIIGSALAIYGFRATDKNGTHRYFDMPAWGGYIMCFSFIFIAIELLDNAKLVSLMQNVGINTEIAISICVFVPCLLSGIIAGICAKSGFGFMWDRKILFVLSALGILISGIFVYMLVLNKTDIRIEGFKPLFIYAVSVIIAGIILVIIDEE